MRVRTFIAADMPEAMARVRAEMGDDAIILSSERSKRGIEVRAAAEPALTEPHASADAADERMILLEAALEQRLIGRLQETAQASPHRDVWTHEQIAARLQFHEVPAPLISHLMAAMSDDTAGSNALGSALDGALIFRPLPAELEKPLVLVGPPGAGKTACATKLAIRAVLAGQAATLLTTDTSAGAASQLGAFAETIRVPLEAVTADTIAALCEANPDRAIIVDTPGVNPYDRADMDGLHATITGCDGEAVAVLPALGGGDLEDYALLFRTLGVRRVIATKLDVSRRLGGLIHALSTSRLALAQASFTPYISETLTPMNPFLLARRVLNELPGGLQSGEPS